MAIKTVIVTPVFSLYDKRLEGTFSKEVLNHRDAIENSLKRYIDKGLVPREVSIDILNSKLRGINANTKVSLEKSLKVYDPAIIVSTPFLLGLMADQKSISYIQDIQTIEILEQEHLFEIGLNKKLHLCLRRKTVGWMIDISTYIRNDFLNASERESYHSIKVLSFVKQENKNYHQEMSTKMIG